MEYKTLLLQFFFLYTVGVCLFGVGDSFPSHADFDPCHTHMDITELWRNPGYSDATDKCDMFLVTAWYAMRLENEPAMIPTTCLQDHTCGAQVPLRVELDGQPMPEVGQNISAVLCGSTNVLGKIDCCVRRQKITIKKCRDDLIVYELPKQDRCNVAICAQKMTESVPEEFLAKDGDLPRSLPPTTTQPRPSTTIAPTTSTAPTTTLTDFEITRTLGVGTTATGRPTDPTVAMLPTTTGPSGLENATSLLGEEAENSTSVFSSVVNSTATETSSANASVTDISKADNDTVTGVETSKVVMTTDVSNSTNLTGSDRNATLADDSTLQKGGKPDEESLQTFNVSSSTDGVGSEEEKTSQRSTATLESVTSATTEHADVCGVSDGVRFVVRGHYEAHTFRSTLMEFAGNYHQELMNSSAHNMTFGNFTITARTEEDSDISSIDVWIVSPVTYCLIPPETLVWVVKQMNFNETLQQNTTLELLTVCTITESCDQIQMHMAMESQFERYLPVIAAVICIAALFPLVLLLVFLYRRYSKRGTWVLAEQEEKCACPNAVENPLSDKQIMDGETETETVLTANGAHTQATPELDILVADEDNGWVVPLEQGPKAQGVANMTQDTRF